MPAARTPVAVVEALAAAAARHGTPSYVYDLTRVRARMCDLAKALPTGVEVRYSVKANPAPAVCRVIAGAGPGAEVSSARELEIALDTGFRPDRIMVSGPYKDEDLLGCLRKLPDVLVSVDSLSELSQLDVRLGPKRRVLLRLRPDYPSAGEMCDGSLSRFGITVGQLAGAVPSLTRAADCVGFHVYGGSQILDPVAAARNLADAHHLATRAASVLGIVPEVLNFGGGFGVPYDDPRHDLDLTAAAAELYNLVTQAPRTRLILELGRYLVAEAGWYLTRVVHHQTLGDRPAVVVDGGIHHRPDLCGLDLAHRSTPPLLLGPPREGAAFTAVLGCLCLPWDVLAYGAMLPPLRIGDILAFPNVGAYGLTAAPTGFLGHQLPAEVALEDKTLTLLSPSKIAEPTVSEDVPRPGRKSQN